MATITIPKNLIMEKDLMVVSRSKYERILSYLKITGEDENLWHKSSKDNCFRSYSKSDATYDQI